MWPDEDRPRGCAYPSKKTPQWEARIKNRDNRRANKRNRK